MTDELLSSRFVPTSSHWYSRNYATRQDQYHSMSVRSLLGKTIFPEYRKIPKISPGAYIFQRPFLMGLFLEGLIFGGVYLLREICVSKSIGLAL